MKKNVKSILLLVFIIAAVIVGVSVLASNLNNDEELIYSDVEKLFDEDLVKSFVVDGNNILKLQVYKPVLDEQGNPVIDPETKKIKITTKWI